jgi:DnaJ-class molecular chaperone
MEPQKLGEAALGMIEEKFLVSQIVIQNNALCVGVKKMDIAVEFQVKSGDEHGEFRRANCQIDNIKKDKLKEFTNDINVLIGDYLQSQQRRYDPGPEYKPQSLEDAVIQRQFHRLCNHKIQQILRCPVCEGRGNVPNGFYSRTSYATTDASPETCKSCNGKGYIQV